MLSRRLKYVVVHVLLAWVWYAALVQHVVGAQRMLLFFTWFLFAVSLLYLSPDLRARWKQEPATWPPTVGHLLNLAFLVPLVWFGWWWTAGAYLFTWIMMDAIKREAAKRAAGLRP